MRIHRTRHRVALDLKAGRAHFDTEPPDGCRPGAVQWTDRGDAWITWYGPETEPVDEDTP